MNDGKLIDMLGKLIRKIWYRGAGVLLYRTMPDGGCNVILFKRGNTPEIGKYSITGGRMEKRDKRDFSVTASRETWEETRIETLIPKDCPSLATNLFFFKWKTYFMPFNGTIDEKGFRRSEILGWIEVPLEEALRRKDTGYLMPRTLRALRSMIRG